MPVVALNLIKWTCRCHQEGNGHILTMVMKKVWKHLSSREECGDENGVEKENLSHICQSLDTVNIFAHSSDA